MNRWIKAMSLVLVFLLAGCGSKSSTTGTPAPTPPGTGGGTITVGGGTTCLTGLPSWACDGSGAAILPADATNYSDFNAIKGTDGKFVKIPVVGDPILSMAFAKGANINIQAKVRLGIEDAAQWWGTEIPPVQGLGTQSSTSLDSINSSSTLSVRVVGTVFSDNTISGTIYYRIRQTGEAQCEQYLSCTSGVCTGPFPPDATLCQTYMSPTQAAVKVLGTFQHVSLSKWATQ